MPSAPVQRFTPAPRRLPIAWSALALAALLAACGGGDEILNPIPEETRAHDSRQFTTGTVAATFAAMAAAPGDVVTLLAKADAGKGEKAFGKCKACHTAEKGGKDKVGPNLWDVVGRAKGGHGGFGYSDALKSKGGEWDFAHLGHFLENPKGFVLGTKMGIAGVKRPVQLADLIVYLRSVSDAPKPLP